jgi:hypothetical protein
MHGLAAGGMANPVGSALWPLPDGGQPDDGRIYTTALPLERDLLWKLFYGVISVLIGAGLSSWGLLTFITVDSQVVASDDFALHPSGCLITHSQHVLNCISRTTDVPTVSPIGRRRLFGTALPDECYPYYIHTFVVLPQEENDTVSGMNSSDEMRTKPRFTSRQVFVSPRSDDGESYSGDDHRNCGADFRVNKTNTSVVPCWVPTEFLEASDHEHYKCGNRACYKIVDPACDRNVSTGPFAKIFTVIVLVGIFSLLLGISLLSEARSEVNNGKKKKRVEKQRAVSEEQHADIVYDDDALVME